MAENTIQTITDKLSSLPEETLDYLAELIADLATGEPEIPIFLTHPTTKEKVQLDPAAVPDYVRSETYLGYFQQFIDSDRDISSTDDIGSFLGGLSHLKLTTLGAIYSGFKAFANYLECEIGDRPKWMIGIKRKPS